MAQNSAFPIAAALASKGLDLAFAMVMLRVLGPADAGKYAWVGVVIGYLDFVSCVWLVCLNKPSRASLG